MLGKVGLIGVGYVLGAKAGRERYEQIRVLAQAASRRLESYGESGTWARRLSDEASRRGIGSPPAGGRQSTR